MRRFKILLDIVIFIIIILVICFLFTNIEKLMPNYEGKIISYSNKYIDSKDTQDPIYYLEKATYHREITNEEKQLLQTKIVEELYKKSIERDLEETTNQKLKSYFNKIKYIIPETKYGDIVYLKTEMYNDEKIYKYTNTLLFTKDKKSIYFRKENSRVDVDTNTTEISKESLIIQLRSFIHSLEIPLLEFEPTTIIKQDNKYIIEDEKNNLKIVYDIVKGEIKEFNFNFY